MTSMNHIVVDVSSDEEDDKPVDYSYLFDEILGISDEKKPIKSTDLLNEDDDDCVILDCDPTAKETAIETCGTDEVLVVGQKGEIACRDFPHPRHACAKYPFKSTLHQTFCEMCHCYVCDTRAPCPFWFSGGISNIDHCHANDKEKTWKNQRECIRTGNMLSRAVSKPASTKLQFKRAPRRRSVPVPVPSLHNSSSPGTQFGIRACSTATRVASRPKTYTRPGNRTEQSRTLQQNPGLQPQAVQSLPNHRGGSNYGNPSPQAVPSNPFVCTRRPSKGVYPPENSVQNISQGSQPTHYAPPMASQGAQPTLYAPPLASQGSQPTRYAPPMASQGSQPTRYAPPVASQGNAQRIVTGYISTVPVSHSKEYAKQFSRNMYSANVQTSAVPAVTPNPPANQQQQHQQSGRSNDRVLSEFEDWLLDDSTLSCPLSGQDNAASTFKIDFETFLND
ncbi:hypothetical protein ISN44_As12g012510 [Arabidopsis suecica]|uniref:RPM1 interacting protein 13 n=1 Tax=Arabidopsis suecica TaxID=45249 RepID=A0A8T1YIA9_ARASU|nr:hypothetical protein ISN44_As12g012510 [Arabidopsis suecica]